VESAIYRLILNITVKTETTIFTTACAARCEKPFEIYKTKAWKYLFNKKIRERKMRSILC
jgi:hypothetical protein